LSKVGDAHPDPALHPAPATSERTYIETLRKTFVRSLASDDQGRLTPDGSNGLADPNLWTNQLHTIDLGVNSYWTQFVKVYLGWQHAAFGNPVLFAPGRMQLTSDPFWLRFQVNF
jgi:hypothetical protein